MGSWAVPLISCKYINSHLPMNSSRLFKVTPFATCEEDQKCLPRFKRTVGEDERNIPPYISGCSGVFWAVTAELLFLCAAGPGNSGQSIEVATGLKVNLMPGSSGCAGNDSRHWSSHLASFQILLESATRTCVSVGTRRRGMGCPGTQTSVGICWVLPMIMWVPGAQLG